MLEPPAPQSSGSQSSGSQSSGSQPDESSALESSAPHGTAVASERPSATAPLRYRVWARAWALGALAHLTLPDALQLSWLVPDLLLLTGALVLLVRPPAPPSRLFVAAWLAAAVGLAWPLLALGDQLTQSGYLLGGALAALLTLRRGDDRDLAAAIRLLTLLVYAVAAFHKLNHDFLDPSVSCATGGMRLLAANWSLPLDPPALRALWPPLFLGVELGLVALFLARPAIGAGLGVAMHIPLTIIFAPSFAWVMIPGWVAFFRDADLRHLGALLRRRWRPVLLLGGALGILSAALYFRDHWIAYPLWQLKELVLWPFAVFVALALARRPPGVLRGRLAWTEPGGPRRPFAWLLAALFLANAATPYLGLQFHHAGAMLSNLRVDAGCWNHLLVPEAVRLREPYVRLDEVRVGGAVRGPRALEAWAEERLWHPASAREAIGEWCARGAAPLALRLRHGDLDVRLEDACAEPLPLPEQPPGLFKTNLLRACPQRCIH